MFFSPVSIAGMLFTALVAIGIPAATIFWLRHKTGHALRIAIVGGLCFVVSVLVLEPILHALVIPLVANIPWLYVIYVCLAAGVFEETARLVGLTFLCKKNPRVTTGAAYGIGHGGGEAVLLVGISALANLLFALTYSANNTSVAMQQTAEMMKNVPSYHFWMGGIERISAMALHFSLSILIWMVVTKRLRFVWYFAAIGLHALTNLPAVLMKIGVLTNLVLVEVLVFIFAAAGCVLVGVLYFRTRGNVPDLPPEKELVVDASFIKNAVPVQPVLTTTEPVLAKAAPRADEKPVVFQNIASAPQPAGDAAEATEVPVQEVHKL